MELIGNLAIMTPKYLTETARRAVKDEATAAKIKAKFLGWKLAIQNDTDKPALLASGQRPDGYIFSVRVAI